MILTLSASILAAALARYGVLSKAGTALAPAQLAGTLITAGVWGYIVAVAVGVMRPEWSPYAVGAAAAFAGYVGDSKLYRVAAALVKKHLGIDLETPDAARAG